MRSTIADALKHLEASVFYAELEVYSVNAEVHETKHQLEELKKVLGSHEQRVKKLRFAMELLDALPGYIDPTSGKGGKLEQIIDDILDYNRYPNESCDSDCEWCDDQSCPQWYPA